MALCGPCQAESDRWLDYRLPVAPALVQIGRPTVVRIADVRADRARRWRTTITYQQRLIAALCATHHKESA